MKSQTWNWKLLLLALPPIALIAILISLGIYRQLQHRDLAGLDTIKAGYGTDKLHVGMRCDELQGKWTPEHPLNGIESSVLRSRNNRDLGVSVVCFRGRIVSLQFHLQGSQQEDSRTFAAFPGKTEDGLRACSGAEEVIRVYGEEIVPSSQPLSERWLLNYETRGISFIFNRQGLSRILVRDLTMDDQIDAEKSAAIHSNL